MRGSSEIYDVLVVGGGPGGSTTAALLSQMGWRVALIEMERHPRFHIGESLLPGNMEIFERLGVMDDLPRIGVVKRAIDFTLPPSDAYVTFDFSRITSFPHTSAFQVRRSEFDHLLLRNAAAKGARVFEGVKARAVEFGGRTPVRLTCVDEVGTETIWSGDFLVDASGRNTFLADAFGLKVRNPRHNSAAMFAHFTGVERRPGTEAGNISVYWFDHGWFWLIPLRDGITSVGVVAWPSYLRSRQHGPDRFFLETIAQCPPLARRLERAELATPVRAAGNYSYAAKTMYGDHFLMVGDAFGFIDPVFSSGVYLAMFGGATGAQTVDTCLREPTRSTAVLERHSRTIRRGMEQLSWLIYRFTTPAIRHMFMRPRNTFGMQDAVIRLLAGDIFFNRRWSVPLTVFKAAYYWKVLVNPGSGSSSDVATAGFEKRSSACSRR